MMMTIMIITILLIMIIIIVMTIVAIIIAMIIIITTTIRLLLLLLLIIIMIIITLIIMMIIITTVNNLSCSNVLIDMGGLGRKPRRQAKTTSALHGRMPNLGSGISFCVSSRFVNIVEITTHERQESLEHIADTLKDRELATH